MKKSIKTRIAAGVIAATTMVSSAASVCAADVSSLFDKVFTESDKIDIVYNGEVLEYTDAQPQIINDRVMIPFRSVLEDMGAQVDYDDVTRTVTASRGDTTINFSLDSNVIDITNGEEKSQLTMDVPIVVVNDRTLVPIRFMSNAFGMNVGWESDLKTVVILDLQSYVDKLEELPNIGKIMDQENEPLAVSNGALSIKYALDVYSQKLDFKADVAYDIKCKDGISGGSVVLNLDIDGLSEIVSLLYDEDIQLKNIQNAIVDIVFDGETLYFKTDLIEKLAKSYPDVKELASVAAFADKNTWFKWEIDSYLEDAFGVNSNTNLMGIWSNNNVSVADKLFSLYSEVDVGLNDVMQAESLVDVYTLLDKYVVINVEENGDYTYKLDIDTDKMIEIMLLMDDDSYSDAYIQEMKDTIKFDIKQNISDIGGKVNQSLEMSMSTSEEDTAMNIEMVHTSTGDKNAEVEEITVPKTALDVEAVLKLLEG